MAATSKIDIANVFYTKICNYIKSNFNFLYT